MEKDNNKNEFRLQEYECGEKANLYECDNQKNCKNLSEIKAKSHLSLKSLFLAFFYPDNYPLGKENRFHPIFHH